MSSKNIIIRRLSRSSKAGTENLDFQPGVNVIAGPPNTGKSKWFQMFDYLMGDPDTPENTFTEELAEKYDSAYCLFDISGKEIKVERRWNEAGGRGKVFVNDASIQAKEFSAFILNELDIPVIHYPKGNPYAERAWPELSWRELLRHIYRQERFWTDIADKQPESVQYACMALFLGLAEKIFPKQLGDLIEKQKRVAVLEAGKIQFLEMLGTISKELGSVTDSTVLITSESLSSAEQLIQQQLKNLEEQRNQVLENLHSVLADTQSEPDSNDAYLNAGQSLSELLLRREALSTAKLQTQDRLLELTEYYDSVRAELGRLKRTQVAGFVLADLKVTHCPVCDQHIAQVKNNPKHCYLCQQPYKSDQSEAEAATKRLQFEVLQLSEEENELSDLITRLTSEVATIDDTLLDVNQEIFRLESILKPARQAATLILPPELGIIDRDTGRLDERLRQIERIRETLKLREEITRNIDKTNKQIAELEVEISEISQDVEYSRVSDEVTDGMNSYLNALNTARSDRWPEAEVQMRIRDRRFDLKVGKKHWTKIGATLQCYLLISYHYALMGLANRSEFNCIGLTILDFPPVLADEDTLVRGENFLIEPFINLCQQEGMQHTQLIVAGRSFESLKGANIIEFTHVWKDAS